MNAFSISTASIFVICDFIHILDTFLITANVSPYRVSPPYPYIGE
uniref:Uncharacterized protein n=1 Tax=virus sp. ct9pU4 TaxID=2828248 RepID=A0A8S5RBR2_9VIRU|nr:MAG TPA: hypothetical protein [virus sp. ct9pU4]